ncbi:hypothetical protein KC332_g2583 [Hortaea werneckii]|uniref:Uncharacterized protein n=2 Tax=Hortaea werneckii TaxID=91943 RepID=A0A3M7ICD0_HORWE|nr:hypothetical protein KC358_g1585 [Hortaea werneckii]OTA37252.1 hypothetical protein BTJ68_02755 [Hortaea werneckii EXF-2000]KAI6849421.1 hypothetical protein KC350_g2642 [Hortaea werneckii]KAI6944037.1 hypothetical protein KC341_g1067 [Hortaea werneckii]KAI6949913.1 hypothetical protein KC348_g1009 [Hortaea werneckii]
MSAYADSRYDEPRRYHSSRTRPRDRDEPDYVREDVYIERGKGPGPRDLVFRGRDDSVEDIPRDFPPPRAQDYRRSRDYDDYTSRGSRSAAGRRGGRYDDDYYDDDRYTDYAAPVAGGAAAGYAAGRRKDRSRSRRRRDDYSDYSDSPPPRSERKERRKSGFEEAIAGLGLGGLAGGLMGKKDHSRSGSRGGRSARSRSHGPRSRRHSSSSRSSSRPRGPGGKKQTERKWAQAAQAALVAGAVEAFRARNEPGPWSGDKGKRIATAALGAGGIDGLIDRNPNKKSKRHLAEAVIGGVAASRLANGPISKSRSRGRDRAASPDAGPRSRSRSIIDRFRGRSRSRARSEAGSDKSGKSGNFGAVKGLAAGGALAAAGKAIYDRVRSKSRNRRSPSRSSSADSYVPSRNRRRDMRRSPPSDMDGRSIRPNPAAATGPDPGRGRALDTNGAGPLAAGAAGGGAGALVGAKGRAPSTDSSSTTDMENKRKHMKGKELLTAGLATIATIHAAHGVYSSMEAHEKRHRLVAEGEMTPEEARKKQTKAWVQDAAAVGIAALGIKGAFSEWKEMNEHRREIHEIEKRKRERRKKRLLKQKQEEHDRQERMMQILEKNPMLAYNMQNGQLPAAFPSRSAGGPPMPTPKRRDERYPGAGGVGGGPPPPPDLSGNPYAPSPSSRYR